MFNIKYLTKKTVINNNIKYLCNFTKVSKFNKNICQEYNILKKLKHPNIVSVIRKEKDNTQLILEKGDCDLYDYILIKNININENDILKIIRNIAEGLHYMHDNNFVHNDIKLENIIIFKNTEDDILAKLIDLEFAHNIKDSKYQNNNCGTELYYSPEISYNKNYCRKSADMWAFGIVIHIMLFGSLPKQNYLLNNNSNNSNNYNSKNINNYDIICIIINNLLKNEPSNRWTANQIINFIIKYKY